MEDDVDLLAYVDAIESQINQLDGRLKSITFTKLPTVPAVRRGRPAKFGKPSRVFSVRLPIDYVAMLIDSCYREGLAPSEYIIRYLELR